ncbi:MAG: flavodoxin [Spirochaetaceae bacterium]|nr:flavodoxin [Spirochaetaceae bacterium]
MRTLIVYYSYEGNCAVIAEKIRAALPDADTLRLATNEDTPRGFFAKYLWGGKQVLSGKAPALAPYTADLSVYGLIIIGTPVWAWSYAPAMRSFLEETKIEGKRIALFCCHGGGKGKTLEKLKKALPGNTFSAEADFREPLKHSRGIEEKLAVFLAGLTD